MELLHKLILESGTVLEEKVLRVDSFLNHGVDPNLMMEIGKEFAEYFANRGINKVITIESSGIAPAVMTAYHLGVPLLVFKKQTSRTLKDSLIQTTVHSFTKDVDYQLTVSRKYLTSQDNVLFIDDFLATGEAALGVVRVLEQVGAKMSGVGIVVEKTFQPGHEILKQHGYDVYSLARIQSLANNRVTFASDV